MRTVAIYRHQLFQRSETFITQQAKALSRFRPVFTGRSVAADAPADAEIVSLGRVSAPQRWRHVLLRDNRLLAAGVSRYRPSLVHAHFGVEGVYALQLAQRLKVPLVTTFHGFDATTTLSGLVGSGKVSWMNYALHRRELARHGALFVCVSDYIRQRVLELGFPPARTVTHHIGIDTAVIRPGSPQRACKRIVHVARLVEKKGTAYLLSAFAAVAREEPHAELVIIGDGPLRKALTLQAQQLGVAAQVRFLGALPHEQVLTQVAGARVFCLPSVTARSGDAEGLPISILEAAAMGVPVLATRHSGIPDAVVDGVTGCLVAERDSDALAQCLRRLLGDADLSRDMGQAGRAMVEAKFDIRQQTGALEALYESIL